MVLQFLLFFLIGFFISVPVGPVGILVARNALQDGVKKGVLVGVGASISDTLYASLLLLNISPILRFLRRYEVIITFFWILILFYLAFKSFSFRHKRHRGFSSMADSFASFFVNISNPAVLFSFSYLFLLLRIDQFTFSHGAILFSLVALFLGSLSWWFVLSSFARSLQRRIKKDVMMLMYQFSGALLLIFAIFMSFYLMWRFFIVSFR